MQPLGGLDGHISSLCPTQSQWDGELSVPCHCLAWWYPRVNSRTLCRALLICWEQRQLWKCFLLFFSKQLHPIFYQAGLLSSGNQELCACMEHAHEIWPWVLVTSLS